MLFQVQLAQFAEACHGDKKKRQEAAISFWWLLFTPQKAHSQSQSQLLVSNYLQVASNGALLDQVRGFWLGAVSIGVLLGEIGGPVDD